MTGRLRYGWRGTIIACGLLSVSMGSTVVSAVESTPHTHNVSKKSPAGDTSSSDASVDRRLQDILNRQDEILRNQQTILQKFDAVMDELRIIKVRASAH